MSAIRQVYRGIFTTESTPSHTDPFFILYTDPSEEDDMPRTCYFIPVDQFDENGYIPSIVTEGESGHQPLKGNGRHAAPWYWGKTYEEAKAVAAKANADDFGLSESDVFEIVASSMRSALR